MSDIKLKKERATEVFHNDLNCAQSVLSVYGKEFGIDEKTAKSVAVGFGSGIGKTQQICGAISGAVMVLGAKYFDEKNVAESKETVYIKTKELIDYFKEKYGDCNCRSLLGIDISTQEGVNLAHEKDVFNLKCKTYLSAVCDYLDNALK